MPSSPRSDLEQMEEQAALARRLKTVGDYKHGSIKRIKLRKFLTYSAAEFSPGPRLNMVVGPNGTGKSSILCAICLGLGGEPRLLGRADQVTSFIQNGETEARIELEVVNEHGENVIVTRTIHGSGDGSSGSNRRANSNKSSTFTWNGEIVSGKKVQERASKDFQIQLDNLCTFLPQEKVGNFSGINSKDLLLETEKTLSDNKDLYEKHLKLIEMQTELRGGFSKVDNLNEKAAFLEAEVAKYKADVDRMEERRKAEEQADLLRKKLMWLKLDGVRETCLALKAQKEEAKQKVENLEDELEPLLQARDQAKEWLEKARNDVDAFEKKIKNEEKNMAKQKHKFDNHDDQIEETLAELATVDNTRAKYENDARLLRDKVGGLQEALDEEPPMEDLEEAFASARREQDAIKPRYNDSKTALLELNHEMSSVKDERNNVQRKLARLQNEKEQRRENVFRYFEDVRNAYHWINNNRGLFRKEVIGPVACEISPKSNDSAAFLEQHVANSVLKSFVVQDKSDYDLLYNKVRREQNIPININFVDRISQGEPRMFSEQKMAVLKRDHGVMGYLDESFDAPDIVVQVLKTNSAIHKVLVGSDRTQDSLDGRDLGRILSESEHHHGKLQSYCIFASKDGDSFKYTSQVSRYSGKPSLRVDDVRVARFLSRGASDDAKQRVTQKLREVKDRENEIQPKIEQCAREQEDLLLQVQQAQQRSKEIKAKIQTIKKLVQKLQNSKRKLREAEERLETDDEEEKRNLVRKLKQRLEASLKAMNAYSESNKKMVELTVEVAGFKVDKEFALVRARLSEEKAGDAETAIDTMRDEFRKAKQQFAQEKSRYKELAQRASEQAPLADENGEETDLKRKLEVDLAQFDREDLAQNALEEAEAKINSIQRDDSALRVYEEKTRELEEVRESLDDLKDRKERGQSELERMRVPWHSTLKEIIETVDKRFTKYMSELGCIGSVSLKDGDNDEDFLFEDYAVEIKVSFREGVKPTVLSSRVQSGGERSVSTIMYLMAMQDMMVSPFRCVDEINQGLDDRNERLVFKRIVENSTQAPGPNGPTDHCGQYWLITPKLLPNLTDMEVAAMNVVCIFNGAYNFKNPTDWCTRELIAIRKRRHEEIGDHDIGDDDDDDDDNTRNKMSKTGE
ncbi:unnamed protein product [Pseudo-nitzschia multistriata]|uniref:Structural maintenance of chromosomes protein 5 n=1 Tax=Pseudo-nitzschia multistriata TaxID=183589 RepID=A0A448ZMH9_9STRA|nr:unnamed protein product [Pseudo-nitzschia multistriata]